MTDADWVKIAQDQGVFDDDLELDEAVVVSPADDGSGAWVRAWVWVPRPGRD
jgi:hypothetical protein